MQVIETPDSLALLALTLRVSAEPPPEAAADLDLARRVLASAAIAAFDRPRAASRVTPPSDPALTMAVAAGWGVSDALIAAVHSARAPADITAGPSESLKPELEHLVAEALPPGAAGPDEPDAYEFAIRRVPLRTSTVPLSLPPHVAGRAIVRSLGPFLDAAGLPLWIDLFLPFRWTALVRTPGTEAVLVVPLQGPLAGAASYRLPTGSIWILSRLLAPDAPDGGYCGIKIKGGTLTLSAPPAVSGDTLQISAGVVATLEIETDPADPPPAGGGLGPDGDASRCQPPAMARFVFAASQAVLDQSSDARLTAYGAATTLHHEPGSAGRMEPLVNRVWLPLQAGAGRPFRIRRVRSELFRPADEAARVEGAWVLTVTVPESIASLGAAEGAGAAALRLAPGLGASWRGLAGGPVRLGETVVMTEPGRLTLAAVHQHGAAAHQIIRLWQEAGSGPGHASQAVLGLAAPAPLRFFSEAAAGDMLQLEGSLDAALDRPVGTDGARFSLTADSAAVLLSQGTAGFQALVLADVAPSTEAPYRGPGSLALSNALLRLTPPVGLLIAGAWDTPDQIRAGVAAVLLGVRAIIPALRDPYVTNYTLPLRYAASAAGSVVGRLIAVVRWPAPETPDLALLMLPGVTGLLGILPPEANPEPALSTPQAEAVTHDWAEDAAVDRALRQIFERTAGPVQERLLLLDVSSSIDQFGIGFGADAKDAGHADPATPAMALQITGLDLCAPARNLRVVLLPQVQWEPVTNQPNPLVGPFPDQLASADDGGATALGTSSVTLLPIAPERLAETMLDEFNTEPVGTPLAAQFTLPFGMKAAARFQPHDGKATRWASLGFHRPVTADGRFTGGLQVQAESHPDQGPMLESPSFPGAAWQTRNGIDPVIGLPFGLSVLSATFGNPGVEKFFNDEMGPSGSRPRVPVTRIEFSGYGASAFSAWANPNAVAETSQVRFDVFVGRTTYEVVQLASSLLPWAAPVVRTITLERKKEGAVVRFDSGWVATGPGLYQYPQPDPAVAVPVGWTAIETHPGVVRGAWNIRRIRETNRVVARDFPPEGARPGIRVELLEVRFDADFDLEGVVKGAGADGRVPSIDQVGYVQRAPQGYPLLPEHLAAILGDEGPVGGSLDCVLDIGSSGQHVQVARVDVAPVPVPLGGPPHFAAAARGALALPNDGDWSAVRRAVSVPDPQPVDAHAGVPLVRAGTASGSIAPSPAYRIAEPGDLLQEDTPDVEFSLLQGAEGHRVLFPGPRILAGTTQWSSTELPALADTYTLSIGVGMVPPQAACLLGEAPWGLAIDAVSGRFSLLPAPTMRFTAPPGVADRRLVDTAPFKIRTRYESEMRFTLDPTQAQPWLVEGDSIFTTMDLGPFTELLGIRHGFRAGAGEPPAFVQPRTIYPPPLQPVVEVLEFLASLLGIDQVLGVDAHQASFNFKAGLALNIVNPRTPDGFIDFGGFQIKGKLAIAVASAPHWNGSLKITLGSRVPVLPPIMGGGEISVGLEGTALAEQKVQIEVKWSANLGKSLGPLQVQATFYFGIQVITSNTGSWQIGVLIGISGTANWTIAKITVRVELLAAIKVLSAAQLPPSGGKQAIGQAKIAADITIAVFVTITVEFSVQVTEMLHI
jgi:hypothetical protein